MADPFLGETRIFSFGFAPQGWALCNGQTLPINQNTALFSLLGTFYGGNGTSNFQLPDLQGRVAISQGTSFEGNNYVVGQLGGEGTHTLLENEMPAHNHSFAVGTSGTETSPAGETFGVPAVNPRLQDMYASAPNADAHASMIAQAGGSQPHNNTQPYLVLSICIALQGIFPSRN